VQLLHLYTCLPTIVSITHNTRDINTQRPSGDSVRPPLSLGRALPALTGTRSVTGEGGGPTAPAAAVIRVLVIADLTTPRSNISQQEEVAEFPVPAVVVIRVLGIVGLTNAK